jgi:hypothetical protein
MKGLVSLVLAGCVLFSASVLYAGYNTGSWKTNVAVSKTESQLVVEPKSDTNCNSQKLS